MLRYVIKIGLVCACFIGIVVAFVAAAPETIASGNDETVLNWKMVHIDPDTQPIDSFKVGRFRSYILPGRGWKPNSPIYRFGYNMSPTGFQDVNAPGWTLQFEPNYKGQAELIWAVNSADATRGVPNVISRYFFLAGSTGGSAGVARLPGTVYFDSPCATSAKRSFVFNVSRGTIDFGGSVSWDGDTSIQGKLNASSLATPGHIEANSLSLGDATVEVPSESQLYVFGNTQAAQIRIDARSNLATQLVFAGGGDSKYTCGYAPDYDIFSIGRSGVAHDFVLKNGYVGIGTTAPTAQLHVAGSVRLSGLGSGVLITDRDGTVSATTSVQAENLSVGRGFSADAGGLKHMRVPTGGVPPESTIVVNVEWKTPFPDMNYTVQCSAQMTKESGRSISVVCIKEITPRTVQVLVRNAAAVPVSGVLHIIAIHD